MTGWLNEEKAAVYAGILDISFAVGRKLLSKVCRVLVFDVFDDGIPATYDQYRTASHSKKNLPSIIVDLIPIPRSINNIEP